METEILYEGKAKVIHPEADANVLRMAFKDDATAGNGAKRGRIEDKGHLNRDISAAFYRYLAAHDLPSHYIESIGNHEMRVTRLRMLPIEFVVRNVAAGSLAKRLGLEEGSPLKHAVLEFYLKNDDLNDPMINRDHIRALELASDAELERASELARRVNELLRPFLLTCGIKLIDFKLEFGVAPNGEVLLGDEISPDTCRFWDANTNEKLDKDRFRRDMGGVADAYIEVLRRLEAAVGTSS